MPLRTLLGYEPSKARARSYDDYGGSFLLTPARSVIATKKAKYQAPMGRVKKLPPIDEESTPASTPRQRYRHEGTQARVTRLPKNTFNVPDRIIEPVKPKPVVPVKPVPRERAHPQYESDFDNDKLKAMEAQYVFTRRPGPYPKMSPKDVNHNVVDGIVADYLHYASYGNIIPVYEGTSSTACPCCTDRNKQNVRTLLGLPKDLMKPAPQKYDKQSKLNELRDSADLDEDARMFPNSMYSLDKKKARRDQNYTPAEKQLQKIAAESQKKSWMNYQPLPYATNYLNVEFNRPSMVQDLLAAEAQRSTHKDTHTIIEANSNYDSAMNKLETLTFGSGSYSDYR